MAILNQRQELSLMSQQGKAIASLVMEQVHVKLGNKTFMEICECPMTKLDEFFWKYLKFEINPDSDPVSELHRIHVILDGLPNHPDIRVFQQIEKSQLN